MGLSVYDGVTKVTVSKVFKRADKFTNVGLKVAGTKQQDGTWKNFNAFAKFIGKAHEKANAIEGAKISTSNYNIDLSIGKDGNPVANLTIFDFEYDEPVSMGAVDTGFLNIPDGLDSELPFN